jgi:hypothetical protein
MSTKKRLKEVVLILIGLMVVFLGIIGCGVIIINSLWHFDFYCQNVNRVAAQGDIVYLLTTDLESNYIYFASEDLGENWTRVRQLPEQIQNDLSYPNPEAQPVQICDQTQPNHCYRISSTSNFLDESHNNGSSWNSLSMPFNLKSKRSCDEPKPTSMVFVNGENQATLIVGMGTGGIFILPANGNWIHHNVEYINNVQ